MADSSSYRPSRGGALTPRRDGASSDPARQAVSDPLAELARLIGQDEAFGAIVRNSARPEPRPEPREADPPPSSWRGRSETAGWQPRQAPAEAHDTHVYGVDVQAHESTAYDPHHYDHAAEERHSTAHHAPAAAAHYGHATGGEYYGEGGDEAHEGQAQAEAHDTHVYGVDVQAHESTAYDPHHYDHAAEERHSTAHHAPAAAAHYGHDTGGEYYGEGGDEAHEGQEGHYEGEEEYADPVPERRRGAIVMVAAVAGLALVGTAGAFGYWAWSTGPRGEPPLIKADTNPNKVVPATQGEGAGNKSVYDRYADKGGTSDRMVSREEAPADIKPAPPRSVYPSAGGVYGPAPAQPAVVAPPASGVSVNGEPRKVHTEVIRPNQMAAADIGQPVAPPSGSVG